MIGLVFVLLLSIIFGLIIPNVNNSRSGRKLYSYLMFFFLFIFVALRGENVGIDTINRYNTFNFIKELTLIEIFSNFNGSLEIGYSLLVFLLTRIFNSPHTAELIYGAFVLGTFIWFFNKYSVNLVLTTFLFIILKFTETMNITRQYIAISFILIVIHYIIQNRVIKASLYSILAMFFHSSAFIIFPYLILSKVKFRLNSKFLCLSTIGALVLLINFNEILVWILNYFPQYVGYSKYGFYSKGTEVSIIWITIYLVIFVCLLFVLKKQDKLNFTQTDLELHKESFMLAGRSYSIITIFYISFVAFSFATKYMWIMNRIQAYFAFSFMLILPLIIDSLFKNRRERFLVQFVFVLLFFVWAILIFQQDGHGILPYQFFWDNIN